MLDLHSIPQIITINQRLSIYLQEQIDQYLLQKGLLTWKCPEILPEKQWLASLFHQAQQKGFFSELHLLTPLQAQACWRLLMQNHSQFDAFLNHESSSHEMLGAWQLIHDWQLSPEKIEYSADSTEFFFQEIALKYQEKLKKEHWVDPAELPQLLCEKEVIHNFNSAHIILIGFDEIRPALQKFLDTFQEHGTKIHIADNIADFWGLLSQQENFALQNQTSLAPEIFRIAYSNTEEELNITARSVCQYMLENVDAHVGIVVQDLASYRIPLLNAFTEVMKPYPNLVQELNISLGVPLAHFPLINTALKLLSLNDKTLEFQEISELLLSPYLGKAETEFAARVQFDCLFRRSAQLDTRYETLFRQGHESIPVFIEQLQQYQNLRKHLPKRDCLQAYAFHFSKLLETLGWPGETPLKDDELQLFGQFQERIQDFLSLSEIVGQVNYQEALSLIRNILLQNLFQPKSEGRHIQILGVLESAGLLFDRLWVVNIHQENWPTPPKPNVFLSLTFQRKLNMPHASYQREFNFYENIQNRLSRQAPHVIFSYAQTLEDEKRHLSPLNTAMLELNLENLSLPPWQSKNHDLFLRKDFEYFEDHQSPAITFTKDLRGGSAILKDQSACPFKAFAVHRLKVQALERVKSDLDARDRGIVLHRILQLIWQELGSQSNLLSLSEDELIEFISKHTKDVLQTLFRDHSPRLIELEQIHLEQLLRKWLILETKRPPFKVIATEQAWQGEFAGIPLRLRIDRIDATEDGEYLVIDYKTAKDLSITKAWLDERLDEPQLPLYGIVLTEKISGLAFGQLSTEDIGFKGLSEHDLNIKGISSFDAKNRATPAQNYFEQTQYWQSWLTRLTEEFLAGNAMVDPRDGEQTCRHCGLKSLCRIHH